MTTAPDDTRSRTGMLRVGIGLLLVTVAWAAPFATASSVLIPARLETIDPADKETLLAIITAAAAVCGLVANVVIGTLSDRTRSRLGSRTPWIVGGALSGAVLLAVVARQGTFAALLLWWCLAIVALNGVTAASNAILPDRVPVARRATLSACLGIGMLLGHAVGAVLGASFVDDPRTGLTVAGVLCAALAVTAVAVAPDLPHDTRTARPRTGLRASLEIPRGVPDFWWALWGRLLLVLGYFMINGYQLYILIDHVGLAKERAAHVLGICAILFLLGAIVGTVLAGPTSDRLGRRKPFVIGASIGAIGAISMPMLWATEGGMLAFAGIGGLAFGCYYAVDAALVSEVLPSQGSRAKDLGILNVANTGGQVLAPAATSVLLRVSGGEYLPVFVVAMACCLVGALLVVPIRGVR